LNISVLPNNHHRFLIGCLVTTKWGSITNYIQIYWHLYLPSDTDAE